MNDATPPSPAPFDFENDPDLQRYQDRLWAITATLLPGHDPDAHLPADRPDIAAVHSACALGLQLVVTTRTRTRMTRTLSDILLTLPGVEAGAPLDLGRLDVRAVLDAYDLGYREWQRQILAGQIHALPGADPR